MSENTNDESRLIDEARGSRCEFRLSIDEKLAR